MKKRTNPWFYEWSDHRFAMTFQPVFRSVPNNFKPNEAEVQQVADVLQEIAQQRSHSVAKNGRQPQRVEKPVLTVSNLL